VYRIPGFAATAEISLRALRKNRTKAKEDEFLSLPSQGRQRCTGMTILKNSANLVVKEK
jgi:hypothetical protein